MLIRRIDHPIICVRERGPWVAAFKEVLDLEPLHAREGDEWGFSNAEIAVGDGLIGVVEPAGETSPLERFLAQHGEGFYALSVDVGDLGAAAARFSARGVPFREAKRDGETRLLWVPPRAACGVLYQISPGMALEQGTNALYRGIPEAVIAVADADAGRATYEALFGFEDARPVESGPLGYRGWRLPIAAAAFDEALIIAEPTRADGPLGAKLAARGEGLFQFTIDVTDLAADLARIRARGVAVETDAAPPRLAWVAPEALRGVRVELRAM